MSDQYLSFVNSPVGEKIAKQVGLPKPTVLERYNEGQEFVTGSVIVGTSDGGRLIATVAKMLSTVSQPVLINKTDRNYGQASRALLNAGVNFHTWETKPSYKLKAIVFDASGIKNSDDLKEIYNFFQPIMRPTLKCARVVVLGTIPELCKDAKERTAQRALQGFIKALGKEMINGGTANLVYVAPDADTNLESSLEFFLSAKSAYVSGQVARVYKAPLSKKNVEWTKPLDGKVALVTGSARGIGEAIAKVLARDGATVVCLDIPSAAEDLEKVAQSINGEILPLDITAANAPQKIAEYFTKNHKGLDIIVHNAGVTRDKTLANMKENLWDMVIDINLSSEERINDELLAQKVINKGGRIICVSSISGIAGNRGQVNYATSKAGVIGMVDAMAPTLEGKGITINAVAPGFIETKMTAAIPVMIREAGRRLNSMAQGGLPIDVAETIAWYANPKSQGVNGNLVRVCGQALIGA
ncbi:MAG: 3-oxoacyl-ACP reductase [Chitinophagales bacterium]